MSTITADVGAALGISPLSRMAYSYAPGGHADLVAMDRRWQWTSLHPEMIRRHLAAYFSHPGTVITGHDDNGLPILVTPMGLEGAGRKAGEPARLNFWSRNSRTHLPGRPSRSTPEGRAWLEPGMASIAYPGTSVHEVDTYQGHCLAVDSIGWQDGWFGENVARFGLKTFWNVNREPWHTQPYGYGNSKSELQADLARLGLHATVLPVIPLATPHPQPTSKPTPLDPEEDDMPRYTFSHPQFAEWFLCGSAPAVNASRETVQAANVPHIEAAHVGELEGYARQAGLTHLTRADTKARIPLDTALGRLRSAKS